MERSHRAFSITSINEHTDHHCQGETEERHTARVAARLQSPIEQLVATVRQLVEQKAEVRPQRVDLVLELLGRQCNRSRAHAMSSSRLRRVRCKGARTRRDQPYAPATAVIPSMITPMNSAA